MRRGRYIVIEGGDGVGKSTIVQLLAERIARDPDLKTLITEEPGSLRDEKGTIVVPIAHELRTMIKAKSLTRSPLTNVLLLNASRRENWLQGIEPALVAGYDVISARNWESTTAYQGFGQGWDIDHIEAMVLEATSKEYMHPDFTFILDLPEKERLARQGKRDYNSAADTFESLTDDFHTRVNDGYRTIAKLRGYPLISARPSPDDVVDAIWQHMQK